MRGAGVGGAGRGAVEGWGARLGGKIGGCGGRGGWTAGRWVGGGSVGSIPEPRWIPDRETPERHRIDPTTATQMWPGPSPEHGFTHPEVFLNRFNAPRLISLLNPGALEGRSNAGPERTRKLDWTEAPKGGSRPDAPIPKRDPLSEVGGPLANTPTTQRAYG